MRSLLRTPVASHRLWMGLVMVAFAGGLAVPADAAANREIPVSLSKYCKSLKLHYAGFNKKTKKFTCAV